MFIHTEDTRRPCCCCCGGGLSLSLSLCLSLSLSFVQLPSTVPPWTGRPSFTRWPGRPSAGRQMRCAGRCAAPGHLGKRRARRFRAPRPRGGSRSSVISDGWVEGCGVWVEMVWRRVGVVVEIVYLCLYSHREEVKRQ